MVRETEFCGQRLAGDFSRRTRENHAVAAVAPEIAEELRTPFEIVFPQFLGYYLSLGFGLDPDPSPNGVITRVVRKFQLHDYDITPTDKTTG